MNTEGRPGALNLCAPIVTLPEHFGEGLTHGRKYVKDKVENAGQPRGPVYAIMRGLVQLTTVF